MSRADRRAAAWSVGLAGALFYLGCPSYRFNFDGVACAIAVELGDWKHLVHGNHLLYGVMGRLFFDAWTFTGYHGRALPALDAMDSLFGGAGLAVFFLVLLDLGFDWVLSLAAAAGLGVSAAYWIWSLEAQVYLPAVFFLLLAFLELLSDRPRPLRAASWHALATLGHAGHALFLPAGLWMLSRSSVGKKGAGLYAAAWAALVGACYLAAAAFIVHPGSWRRLAIWLLGSAALGPGGAVHWHAAPGFQAVAAWLLAAPRIFCDPLDQTRPPGWGWLLGAVAISLAIYGAWRLAQDGSPRPWKGALFLWLGCYALLYLSWEPATLVYRISDLPALWIFIAIGARALGRPARPLLASLALGLGLYNGFFLIIPFENPAANRPYQEALGLAERTPQDAWIVTSGIGAVYLPYFARRKTIDRRYYEGKPEALRERIAGLLARGEAVYWDSGASIGIPRAKDPKETGRKN